ncbi:serine/threonine protein kinase [Emergomyces pasteurianus Ep9510]|uniref:Autophagy-related protein 1 n=1 Tax=Emergomyces pasteurianus Ep9510 TaxID=1447872 RepID=A0A1J9P996_9EURO|nr:serine/threonine protein kinase [Emergomyces pasteurianus Ep9510]
MVRSYADTLERNDCVGTGSVSLVYNVSPTIVVKTVRGQRSTTEEHPFRREIKFYECLNKRQDRCPDIVECFLALPDHLFLSYCDLNNLPREELPNGWPGRLICVNSYEDHALIARWIQQVTSALEYIEKMGFSHNDVHPRNCLLDKNFNLKLSDFDWTTTIGQFLLSSYAPWARKIPAGQLKGSYDLCGARTEQFAVGTLLYYMVYGQEPYEDIDLKNQDPKELDRRFQAMEFPKLDRHEVFDDLISACWHNVYPTMALLAYDCKRKTKELALDAEYNSIDSAKERKNCKGLIQRGLLGHDLAVHFQPVWQRYFCAIVGKSMFVWQSFSNLLRRYWCRS